MKKIFCISILFVALFLNLREIDASESSGGTQVNGIITSDVTWTKVGSPYTLVGNVQIGGKLKVEPGTVILGNSHSLTVFGEVNAEGEAFKKINIMNLIINAGNNKSQSGTIKISNSNLINCQFSNYSNGYLQVKDSWIDDSMSYLYYQKHYIGYSSFEKNIFTYGRPIVIGSGSSFTNNVFYLNNNIEINGYSQNHFLNNSFYMKSVKNSISLSYSYSSVENMANNYWGTTDKNVIDNILFDKNDDLQFDSAIVYAPYLNDDHEDTPQITHTVVEPKILTYDQKNIHIEGVAEPDSIINYEYGHDSESEIVTIGQGNVFSDSEGRFSINLNESKDYSFKIFAYKNGVRSSIVNVEPKDTTPPESPLIDTVNSRSEKVTGTAERNSIILIKSGEQIIGEGITDIHGAFSIKIAKQKDGTELSITSIDASHNISEAVEIMVEDATPPILFKVDEITDHTTVVSGLTEPGATVRVYSRYMNSEGSKADKNGRFKVMIRKQRSGEEVSVYAFDEKGNMSLPSKFKVLDRTAPSIPSSNQISDKTLILYGHSETNSKVSVKHGTKILGTTIAKKGNYSIKIPKQKAGVKLSLYAVDASGNQSRIKQISVLDRTAPSSPFVNRVSSKSTTVSGRAENYTSVLIYVKSNLVAKGAVSSKGNFKVKIKKQKKGTVLTFYVIDKSSNKSKAKIVKVS